MPTVEGDEQRGSNSTWWNRQTPQEKRRTVTSAIVFGGMVLWLVLAATILEDTFTALELERRGEGPDAGRDELYEQQLARRESAAEVNETAVIGAIIGFVLGPIMLVWGYQIVPLVIVCNALISSGVSNFLIGLQYMAEFNKDISDGRLVPSQAMQLFKLLLSAFTLSTVAMKIEFFSAAMKAGVVSFVAIETIANQIPPQYGCICLDGTVGCSPLYREELYRTENACYQDWWMRFGLMMVTVLAAVVVGVRNPVATNKINIAIVGANLCCQAIFDTVLAVLPSHGSRVAPYRMVMLASLSVTSYKIHEWLGQMDAKADHELAETEILPLCYPLVFSLQKLGLVVMLPLKTLSDFFAKLRTFGQANLIAELLAEGVKKGGAGAEALLSAHQRESELEKLREQQASAQDLDGCARTLVRAFNLAFVPLGVALIALGSKAADSEWKDFLSSAAIACIIAAGMVLLGISCLGFCGAHSRSRGMLLAYMVVLAMAMVLQIVAAGMAYELRGSMQAALDGSLGAGTYNTTSRTYSSYADDALDTLRRETEGVFNKSQCTFASPHAPLQIKCARNAWFEDFANAKCTSFNTTDVDYLSGRVTTAIAMKQWSTADLQYSRLKSVSSIAVGISECNSKYKVAAFGSPGGLFCVCRSALVDKLNGFVMPAATMSIVLALMELVVLINCVTILSAVKRIAQTAVKIKHAEKGTASAPPGGSAIKQAKRRASGTGGGNPVEQQPTSISKGERASNAKVLI